MDIDIMDEKNAGEFDLGNRKSNDGQRVTRLITSRTCICILHQHV